LLQAAISLSWSAGLGGEFGDRPSFGLAMDALSEILSRGVQTGELKATPDQIRLAAEVLWDAYVANYRRALFDDWSAERLIERVRQQVQLVLSALR
jgi:hypothetical protein